MKLSCRTGALALGILSFSDFLTPALALPKTLWAQQRAKSHGKKVFASAINKRYTNDTTDDANDPEDCYVKTAADIAAPKDNIWAGLTDGEAASVTAWLFAQPELNLTTSGEAGEWDNTIILVELMAPNKTDALAYLDGTGSAPDRYAHAIIDHAAGEDAYYGDIIVGPLPVVNGTTTWQPLEYPYSRKTSGRVRNLDASSDSLYEKWIYVIGAEVADITMDLWGASCTGSDNDTLDIWGIDPTYQEGDSVKMWNTFWSNPTTIFDVGSMMPMGLFFLSDITGRDISKWKMEGWYYNGVFYETTEEFRAAYWNGEVEKLGGNFDGDWADTDQQGDVPPFDTLAPPVSMIPQGSRYSVDPGRKYVEWMDWSFYIGFDRDRGMTLWDIRYNGTRILYELGLQEALAHYAGSDPVQSHVAYLDTYYGFGPFAFELLKGYDCPSYSTFLNSSFYVDETTHTHINSICLFEFDADYPLARHSSSNYVTATKNVHFTVRSVSTVGNYDYMFSYTFFMDGSVAVEARASGYIQAAFYALNEEYGFKIHDHLSGSMHDHVLNFKADFDIMGTENTVEKVKQVPHTTTYPWSKGKVFNTMKLDRSFIETEDEGQLFWSFNNAEQIFVVNQEVKNSVGESKGYRILPYTGTAHLTVEGSTVLKNSAHWAEHDLMITKQRDTEPRSSHPYNNQDTENPPVNFATFFDGESLNQTDLVVWFNLGMHHVPNTGDLPTTVFTTAHSGIQFMPANYFDVGVNKRTVNMVRVNYDDGEATEVATFGSGGDTCELNYEPAAVDLWEYVGDVVVRKFPYLPDDPYYETDSIV
ncbi:hypothetical protein MKZ38_010798 [Zalerion maritima]|uniref:Amine oxidase n=1 Tax=Zalerion maritima TaxID=339359 RepID=A0AAD5RZ84_9PEZI|nr:hypothetical protein MKZ38_010798 [Zalerion maritima]